MLIAAARLRDDDDGDDGEVRVRVAGEVVGLLSSSFSHSLPEFTLRMQTAESGLVYFRGEHHEHGQHSEGKGSKGRTPSAIEFDPKLTGKLIGTKGATIKKMQAESGARIKVNGGSVQIRGTPEQVKLAEDAVREILKPSYGIVAWYEIDGGRHMLQQLSYSTKKHGIKIDPLRGKWKPGESPWSTACRVAREESAELLRFDPSLDGLPCCDGLFHVRVRFEDDAERRRFLATYDANRQRIVQGVLGAKRAQEADQPAKPVALVWLNPDLVDRRELVLPLQHGDCSPAILQRSRVEMGEMLHEKRRVQLTEYPQDWPGMAQALAKQHRDFLLLGQIDLPLLSSTCRLHLEFGMDVPAPACTVPEALLRRIDEVLSCSARLLGSCVVKIDELPIDELHAAVKQICDPFHQGTDLVAARTCPSIAIQHDHGTTARQVLSVLGEKAAVHADGAKMRTEKAAAEKARADAEAAAEKADAETKKHARALDEHNRAWCEQKAAMEREAEAKLTAEKDAIAKAAAMKANAEAEKLAHALEQERRTRREEQARIERECCVLLEAEKARLESEKAAVQHAAAGELEQERAARATKEAELARMQEQCKMEAAKHASLKISLETAEAAKEAAMRRAASAERAATEKAASAMAAGERAAAEKTMAAANEAAEAKAAAEKAAAERERALKVLERERATHAAKETELGQMHARLAHEEERRIIEERRRVELERLPTLYHGTSLEAALKIQDEGFRVDLSAFDRIRSMLGAGLYLSTTLAKAQAAGGIKPHGGVVLVLRVDLGNCNELKHLEEFYVQDLQRVHVVEMILGNTRRAKDAGYSVRSSRLVWNQ